MRHLPCLPFLILAPMVLAGCGAGGAVPSEADGRVVVESQFAGGGGLSGSAIRIAGFRKTNGQEAEVHGVRVYRMDYEVEIECLEGVSPLDVMNVCVGRRVGDSVTRTGALSFEETEGGWRGENGSLY